MVDAGLRRRSSWNAIRIAVGFGVVGLMVAACGGSETTTTTEPQAGTTEAQANVVHVELTESESGTVQGVETDVSSFTAGVQYHFVVENSGERSHELMIIEPVEPGTMDMEQMDEMALFVIEEDDLSPGSTHEFDFTFPADAVGTSLEFACYLEGHYEAGMHTPIIVEQ